MSDDQSPTTENFRDEDYFKSYENLDVHNIMLKDKARVMAYKTFIDENQDMFKDKVVVDVGAGTGILSLFAAKAGAQKVFAIEASDICTICAEIVAANNYQNVISVIHGCVEDIDLPDGIRADIIISEWMGFYLLHESMLSSVLTARDKYLKQDGILLPTTASIIVAPVSLPAYYRENFDCWRWFYGFNFTPVLSAVKTLKLRQPQIIDIEASDCIAEPEELAELDLRYLEMDDIQKVLNSFQFIIRRNCLMHGIACWFDVEFEGARSWRLSTGPTSSKTHWHQTVVLLPDTLLVSKDSEVQCTIIMDRDDANPRRYNISIELAEDEEEMGVDTEEDEPTTNQNDDTASAEMIVKNTMSKDV